LKAIFAIKGLISSVIQENIVYSMHWLLTKPPETKHMHVSLL